MTDVMRGALKVTRSPNALVIEVVAGAADPVSAGAIANAVVGEYLARQGRAERQVADQALAWMEGEIERPPSADRRAQPAGAGRSAGNPRRRTRPIRRPPRTSSGRSAARSPSPGPNAPTPRRASASSARRSTASASRRRGSSRDARDLGARRQLADLGQRLAAERASRGDTRPVVAELQAQIASLRDFASTLVEQEPERLDLDLASGTNGSGRCSASRAGSAGRAQLEQTQVAIADIEREAAANQELYVVLLTRLNEIAAQEEKTSRRTPGC